ncbi:DUF4235 domain-containing protein [Cellulomonas sp. C5510]|uniref:DUF4235 domain-containing protein n=1 Tax=Cellulomonas sp. C5510 TaxID=2871170 RepID=UPI001C98AAFB|nr:DUF4235 domain-containing protein [Cellulomonas sp. C5510]QZN85539.1 DUF4235 domain-containing protein [Cellulomonas sp. C5510]
MADEETQSTFAKITGLVVAGAVAWLAGKAVDAAWKAAVGHKPPKPEDDADDIRIGEVVAASVITAGAVTLARVFATRGTKKFVQRVDRNRRLPHA